MKIVILKRTNANGRDFEPGPKPVDVTDEIGTHLCAMGHATAFTEKVVAPTETKSKPAPKKKRLVRKKKTG